LAEPNAGDYIELTLPTRLSAEQRSRMIAAHSRLLGILNGPNVDVKGKSLKAAKEAARKAMRDLHKQIATLGGRIDARSSHYQMDPTTGEITGIIGNVPAGPPAKPKAIQTADKHQVRVPVGIEKAPAPKPAAAPTGIMAPLTREQALAGTAGPTMEQLVGAGQGVRVPTAIITDPALAAAQPTPSAASTELKPIAMPATVPQVTPVVQAATAPAAAPSVPSAIEDLNADPLLGALPPATGPAPAQQPAAAAETPEMTLLRRLIAEPEPPPPDTGLTTGQKAAYGFLVGLKPEAARGVGEIISGQRAEAAQRYVLTRQNREALINNLTRLVQLQGVEAERAASREEKRADLVTQAEASANKINILHGSAAYTMGTAYSLVAPNGPLADNPDPALQARATTLFQQIAEVKAAQNAVQAGFDRNPLSIDQNTVDLFDQRIKALKATADDAISELAKKVTQTRLPSMIQRDINEAELIVKSGTEALGKLDSMLGVIGPFDARVLKPIYTLFSDRSAEEIGQFETLLAATQATITALAGRSQSTTEQEVFGGFKLPLTLPQGVLRGRLIGSIKYAKAKIRQARGEAGAGAEAERIAIEDVAGGVPIGLSRDGFPIYQTPDGELWQEER